MVRILHDDWSVRLGENTPDQRSETFDGYKAGLHGHLLILFYRIMASQISCFTRM